MTSIEQERHMTGIKWQARKPLKIRVVKMPPSYRVDYVELTDQEAMNRPVLLNPPLPPLIGPILVKLNHGQATDFDLEVLRMFKIKVEEISEEEAADA